MKDHLESEVPHADLRPVTDDALLARLDALVQQEREDSAGIVEHLAEVDRRELAIDRGFPSLFDYCRKRLRYSEAGAFLRIRAARAANDFPRVLDDLRSGALHLDAIARLYPLLTQENSDMLLDQAAGASKREVLALVARLGGGNQSSERDTIRFLPPRDVPSVERNTAELDVAVLNTAERDATRCNTVERNIAEHDVAEFPLEGTIPPRSESLPLEHSAVPRPPEGSAPSQLTADGEALLVPPPMRVRLAFTADDGFLIMVQRLRSLMRHRFPSGKLEDLLREAVEKLLKQIDPDQRAARRTHMRSGGVSKTPLSSRKIPAAVKAEVWERDSGRCAYMADGGLRCESREFLEYDHVIPWSLGGRSNTAENVRLLCRSHNQRLARKRFGPRRRS